MEARLVDEEYKDVKEGEAGELLLRGPVRFQFYSDTGVLSLTFHFQNIMIQYHKNPEATAKTIDKDGWMGTGELDFPHNFYGPG